MSHHAHWSVRKRISLDRARVAERLLGDAVRERTHGEDVIISTKGGLRKEGDHLLRDASRRWLREGVESSLRNLGTDYIDIYHVHWPDPHTPPEETAGALDELIAGGKIRHVGVSNYDVAQMEALGRSGGWRRCSRRTTCSGGTSSRRSCPLRPRTTSTCWRMGRWPMACSPAG